MKPEDYSKESEVLRNPNPNSEVQLIRCEKEIKRLLRENNRFIKEINKLNNLIEQMKNIDDDELLMIEKIQTKEIYGKTQKVKISELQKETEKIRIEIDRLRVINNNKDRIVLQKEKEINDLRREMEEGRKERVVTKVEFRDSRETLQKMRDMEQESEGLRKKVWDMEKESDNLRREVYVLSKECDRLNNQPKAMQTVCDKIT
jgi:chromosome segregation ATPase